MSPGMGIWDLVSVYPPAQPREGLKWRLIIDSLHCGPSRRRPPGCSQLLPWPLAPRTRSSKVLVCLFLSLFDLEELGQEHAMALRCFGRELGLLRSCYFSVHLFPLVP